MNRAIITSYTNKEIDLIDIKPSNITLEDIAHGLSYTCRFVGQCKHFYSVAQHSINCLKVADSFDYNKELKLYTLLHDASEAYICDMPSPLKKLLPEYSRYEKYLQKTIYQRFDLEEISIFNKKLIKEIDNIMFYKEWKELMDIYYDDEYTNLYIPNLNFEYKSMEQVEIEFIQEAKKLIKYKY